MKPLRVLMLTHPELVPPDSLKSLSEAEAHAVKTESDVVSTLRAAGHEVKALGVAHELKPIRDEIESFKAGQSAYRLRQFERGLSHTAKVSAKSSSG